MLARNILSAEFLKLLQDIFILMSLSCCSIKDAAEKQTTKASSVANQKFIFNFQRIRDCRASTGVLGSDQRRDRLTSWSI